jgi:CubicO group peptidase (beta-lactamase class C family)
MISISVLGGARGRMVVSDEQAVGYSRRIRRIVLGIVLISLAAGCTAKPAPADPSVERLTQYLDGVVRAQGFRGSVQVRLGDRVLVNRGYDQANGPDTRFRIGSLTKQFTALGVLKLQEQGKLRTSDLVCAHLPRCPPAWAAITLDHLLTHTAGVPNYTDLSEAELAAYAKKIGTIHPSPEQLVGLFLDRPLDFPPGTQFKYSNSGYALLGYVIEQVTGQAYGTFLRQQILDPLEMADTGYPDPADQKPVATGYQDWSTPVGDPNPTLAYAAGGLYSTTNDLARWNHFLMTADPPVVSRDTLAQLFRPRLGGDVGDQYGYGISIRGSADNPTYYHDGKIPGFESYNEIRPATKLSVTVLSNLFTSSVVTIGNTLANLAQ